jgi:beta-lactamase superfamily II metal-dependent hydrolase
MLKFFFWNVQHGAACYIQTDNGRNIIVDLGGGINQDGFDFSPIDVLRAHNALDQLHLLVITHPHEDHIIDLPALRGVPIRKVLTPQSIPEIFWTPNGAISFLNTSD